MRRIEGQVTNEISSFVNGEEIDSADAYPVTTYRQLVEHVAKLAYLNKDQLLFYRGQGIDYRTRTGASTFYPTIYRGDYLQKRDLKNRFEVLDIASSKLREIFKKERILGFDELIWKKYIQWSVLQHYEVCNTPLLDLTHSLRVACSFAQIDAKEGFGYVYIFGLPYIMNRISHNSEHDIVNIRLLSICPPDALRPYFQEGFLAGTEDITNDYDSKDKLDFRNRLIAKFQIPSQTKFWGSGFSRIPGSVLYPRSDRIEKLCKEINLDVHSQLLPGNLGEFLQEWAELENFLLTEAGNVEKRVFSIIGAIKSFASIKNIENELINELHELRKFRNIVVHEPKKINQNEIEEKIIQIKDIRQKLVKSK